MASTGRPASRPSGVRARRCRGAAGRGLILSAIAVFLYGPAGVVPVSAAPSAEDLKRGETLLSRHCGTCHAVGRTGNSPRPDAPAFRVLGKRYPIDSLEESLGEGIMSGHPDMPEMSFDGDDVGAIVDYLKSIQMR